MLIPKCSNTAKAQLDTPGLLCGEARLAIEARPWDHALSPMCSVEVGWVQQGFIHRFQPP